MITREKCLELARKTGTPYVNRHYPGVTSFGFTEETLEALCNRVWNEAIEAAAKKTDDYLEWCGNWGLYSNQIVAANVAREITEELRKLKQGEPK